MNRIFHDTILIFVLFGINLSLFSQTKHICGSDEYESMMSFLDEQWIIKNERLEGIYYKKFSNPRLDKSKRQVGYVLPVTFHVIHDGGIENISDAIILKSLEQLNQAFANQGTYYNVDGVNTDIQFCLAQTDENGKKFNGIKRYKSIYTDMSLPGSFEYLMDFAVMDYNKYINIQIVKKACLGSNCNIVGFAGAHRIVLEPSALISTTFMHEVGHFLGLKHTFQGGCKNSDCLRDGDNVCDTPPDQQTYDGCFGDYNSCTSDTDDISLNNPFRSTTLGGLGDQPDDHTNYMDYNFIACRTHFTQGQVDRMHFVIDQRYSLLVASEVCAQPCPLPLSVEFNLPRSTEIGTQLTITNQSSVGDQYIWIVNGQEVSKDRDLIFVFNTTGNNEVTLIVVSSDTLCNSKSLTKTIDVSCNIEACMGYKIEEGFLILEDCTVAAIVSRWQVLRGSDTLLLSDKKIDSISILAPDLITVILVVEGQLCNDQVRRLVSINPDNIEICNNGFDDDSDGLVDIYDSDCLCDSLAFQAQCPNSCEIIPNNFEPISLKLKWKSEVVGSSIGKILAYNEDGISHIVTRKSKGFINIFTKSLSNHFLNLDGNTGKTNSDYQYTDANQNKHNFGSFAMFKYKDTIYTVFMYEDSLCLMDANYKVKWKTEVKLNYGGTINITDFNSDGIPEIYFFNKLISIFNGSVILEDIIQYKGGNDGSTNPSSRNEPYYSNTIAADLLPSPGLELAAGNVVYEVKLSNQLSSLGNIYVVHTADVPVQDGITSVGDVDGDGQLDVIVVRNQFYLDGGGIYVWNPRTGGLIASAPSAESGSIPFIGDVDGDCQPEIGVVFANELRIYKYDGTQNLNLLYSLPTTDRSGVTGITMFDFNQDGKYELVYRDQTTLRVIAGATGVTLASSVMLSGTGSEYPIVVDVDNDGQAEILTSGYLPGEKEEDSRVYCFESNGSAWAPARSVWNQYGYHVTNVNDDLTIPRQQQNMATFFETDSCSQFTCPQPYNAFMTQATYRTQNGCKVWPTLPDLRVSATLSCIGDSLDICLIAIGRPDTMTNVPISCYPSFPLNNETIAKAIETTVLIDRDTLCMRIARMAGMESMIIVINDDGKKGYNFSNVESFSKVKVECRYDNNQFVLPLPEQLPPVDLGMDKSGCVGQVITISAPDGYNNYLWNDGSTDRIFTTGLDGIYWVEARDTLCGMVSTDTIILSITPAFVVDLGIDKFICPDEIIELSYFEPYDQLYWSPSDQVLCDTCAITTFVGRTDTSVSLHVINQGCISNDTIDISLSNTVEIKRTIILCDNQAFTYRDSIWKQSGLYTYKVGQCDSILTFDLQIKRNVETNLAKNICEGDSILIGGLYRKTAGVFEVILQTIDGCDSLVRTELIINPQIYTQAHLEVCSGEPIIIHNVLRTVPGIYIKSFSRLNSCDSISRVEMTWSPPVQSFDSIWICPQESAIIHGQSRNIEGHYIQAFKTAQGCDSISDVYLVIAPFKTTKREQSLCLGDSLLINNRFVTSGGTFIDTLQTSQGCAEIVIHEIKLLLPTTDSTINYLCPETSIIVNGQLIGKVGNYTFSGFINAVGCDSSLVVTVMELPSSLPPLVEINCEEREYIVTIPKVSDWDYFDRNIVNGFAKDLYKVGGEGDTLYLSASSSYFCDKEYITILPPIPRVADIPQLADFLNQQSNSINVTLPLDVEAWSVVWSPSGLISCDTCMSTTITFDRDTSIVCTLTHETGCVFIRQFRISLKPTAIIILPNVFNPSGTSNPEWKFDLPKGYRIEQLQVYDRWGALVYSIHDSPSASWDGTFKQKQVMSGVYVYVMKYSDPDGNILIHKGDVTLLR